MNCPVCDERSFAGLFVVRGLPVARCQGCGCVALDALPVAADSGDDRGSVATDSATERDAAARYLAALRRRGVKTGSMLVVSGAGPRVNTEVFVCQAKASGFRVDLLNLCGASPPLEPAAYDAAVMLHQLQTQPAPGRLLNDVHAALRPDAPLLLTLPGVRRWTEWPPENRLYFDRTTIQLLLLRYGFHDVLVRPDRRGMIVTAVRAEPPARPKCSIIVAAYNEARTFPILMDALLRKELPGVDREIIIVESNSTDGTRELTEQYRTHPDIKIVLQDQPRGKGNAIRQGFRHATGDVVLIQDADLEYDLNDYGALLAPILSNRALFVLGTRHGGRREMRKFTQQKGLAAVLNLGHWFFTGLMNVLFRQNMTDPFTMFKVFRRDGLFALEFECNRFDFDHELVIKLVRKGYVPVEIPVNYSSRSFSEGKKVRLFRDPPAWLWVNLKLRVTRVFPKDLA
jgi:SAM-dependent methyltransferase